MTDPTKNLHRQLASLPWAETNAKFYDRTAAHGRLETRVVHALTISDLGAGFPHAVEVAKNVRHRPQRKTGRRSRETVCVAAEIREMSSDSFRRPLDLLGLD